MAQPLQQATQRLQVVLGLSAHSAGRAVAELLDYFDREVDEHIRSRHAELQRAGLQNPDIYAIIQGELGELRFKAPKLSPRQIRRRIYG